MATMYDYDTGNVLMADMEGRNVSGFANDATRFWSFISGRILVLEDDDGKWIVHPDGKVERA
jgi:hypothetical protein